MNVSYSSREMSALAARSARWSLTKGDVLLCMLPIALFLSIMSLV